MNWTDPRLADWPEGADFPADLWVPPLGVWGQSVRVLVVQLLLLLRRLLLLLLLTRAPVSSQTPSDRDKMNGGWKAQGSLGFIKGGRATGEMTMWRTFKDESTDCKPSSDLRLFPMDSHDQRMTASLGRNVMGNTKLVRVDPDTGPAMLCGQFGTDVVMEQMEQGEEWHVTAVRWGVGQHTSGATGICYHDFYVEVHKRRVAQYYLVKVRAAAAAAADSATLLLQLLPLLTRLLTLLLLLTRSSPQALYPTALCGLLSLSALVVPAAEVASRMSVILTLFLTVFAIQWVTTDRLPKTPFLTKLDRIIALTVLFIVAIGLLSMGMKIALRFGADPETIETLEGYQFGVFAAVFLGYATQQLLVFHSIAHSKFTESAGPAMWTGAFWEASVDPVTGAIGTPRPLQGAIDRSEYALPIGGEAGTDKTTFESDGLKNGKAGSTSNPVAR